MLGLIFKEGKIKVSHKVPEPEPAEGELLIHVEMAGLCATDMEISKGYMSYEGILGHEFVGKVDAPDLPEWHGRRVVGGINCSCGICSLCREGLERHCPSRTVLGIAGRPGAFAERLTLPQENLVKVPESVSVEDAVYAEPVAAALRIREQSGVSPLDRVAVLGDGRLGLLVCGVGSSLGWNLSLVGLDPKKMKKVAHLVASHYTPNEGPAHAFDLVVDCTGSPHGIEEALRLLKPQGRLVMKTTTHEGLDFNFSAIVINEISVIGSRCGSMEHAVEFLARGIFEPSILTSARFLLSQGDRAFEAAMEPGQIKVVLDMPMKQ